MPLGAFPWRFEYEFAIEMIMIQSVKTAINIAITFFVNEISYNCSVFNLSSQTICPSESNLNPSYDACPCSNFEELNNVIPLDLV